MKIDVKFGIGFLIVLLLFGAASYLSVANIGAMQNSFKLLNEYHKPVIDSLRDMELGALRVVSSTMEYSYIMQSANKQNLSNVSEEQGLTELNLIAEGKNFFSNAFGRYEELTKQSSEGEQELGQAIKENWTLFVKASDNYLASQKDYAPPEEVLKAKERFERSEESLLKSIGYAIELEGAETKETDEEVAKTAGDAITSTWVAFFVLAAIAFVSLGAVSYSITKPIERLRRAASEIGRGNLNTAIDVSSKDEIGDLAGAFNKMAADLKKSRGELIVKSRDAEESKLALESRVKELTETKHAMLNMMEDAENTNRELIIARNELSKNVAELKDANVKKNEFMSIAAHELKTPMTSIHGFSQLLQNPAIANDAEKRNKYLAIMDHETKRLAKLVTDVLDISRIDLNAVTFDIAAVDLRELLEAVKTEMDMQIKQKGLKSEYIVDKNLPEIYTDKERITQVLMNLINNAVKYTPKGKITVSVLNGADGVRVMVKDTGIGISKKDQPKIFTRFYQVDSSYTRSAGGVGLGLSLCKEFVGRLGGKIWFKSAAGKGSEFYFTLPKPAAKAINGGR